MNKKLIMLLLTASCVTTGVFSAIPITKANAQTLNSQVNTIEENDLFNVIEEIESKYLIQHADGTFSIDNSAYNVFDKEILDFIKSGSEEINSYIKADILKFELNENKEVVNTYEDINKIPSEKSWQEYGNISSSYTYCSNFKWYWWGYKTNVNVRGSEMIKNLLVRDAATMGGLVTIAVASNPIAGAIAAVAGAIGGVTLADGILNCSNGITSKKGVIATGWGKPSTGCLMGVQALY